MDKKLTVLLSGFFIAFLLFAAMILFNANPLVKRTQATEETTPSGETSILLAFPLTIPSDGITKSSITAFVRSKSTKPSPNHVVTFNSSIGALSIVSVSTDATGKASTYLTCNAPGKAEISAIIDNSTPIVQKVTIMCQ